MKNYLRAFTDFFIYSSCLIALAALFFTWETYVVLSTEVNRPYIFLIFFSTIFIYSMHRIVGIRLLNDIPPGSRFSIIIKFRNHLILYAVLSFLACFALIFMIEKSYIMALLPAGLLSFLYIIPFFGGKRLRDYAYFKIFLIAIVWSYATTVVPAIAEDTSGSYTGILLGLEKFLFILAVTIPFDIRDLDVDQSQNVRTLPALLGVPKSYRFSKYLLVSGILLLFFIALFDDSSFAYTCFLPGYLITSFIIDKTEGKSSDYYFSGWLDASIIIRSGIIIGWNFI